MNFVVSSLTKFYSQLLLLYPVRFRAEFAEEMQIVFEDSVNEAAKDGILSLIFVWLRELGGLPSNILREFWHELQGKELTLLHENVSSSPATTRQVLMGALPFFLFGIILIMFELPISLSKLDWFNSLGGFLFGALLILPAIGFGIGWVQSFPPWSFPYAGMALILAFYIQNVTTPGLNFLGIPIFGRELWGWRAWIPLAAAFVIGLAVSRSFKPFTSFFANLWQDWSIPSYFMTGALPLLVFGAFDEIDHLYSLYFMVPFAVLLVGMVIFYLRSQHTWQRVLVLTIGILAIIFPAVLGSNSYWLKHQGMHLSGAQHMLGLAGKVALIMLLPAWLELLRRSVGRVRTT